MILPPDIEKAAITWGKNDADLIALAPNLNGDARVSSKVPKTAISPFIEVRGDVVVPIGVEEYHLFSGFVQWRCFAWLDREDQKPDHITANLVGRTLVAKMGTFRGKIGDAIVTGIQVNAGPVRMPDSQHGWACYRVDSTWVVKRSG